ncbi:MAG: hypothetical protein IRZ16_19385 [Myxococcaceae bacterium]|nr:hypothetical protein [Myxococcaceae bacterium]
MRVLLPSVAFAVLAVPRPAHAVLFVEGLLVADDLGRGGSARGGDAAADSEATSELPPFDATPVALDPKLRIEAHAALWLIEQAGRLRTTHPALGVGLGQGLSDRIRWHVGALLAFGRIGTPAFNVFSLYPMIHARAHYGWALGGSWLFVGAGPSITAVAAWTSISGTTTDTSFTIAGGPELALGLQTEVAGRLVRFEVALTSRGLRALRIDGRAGLSVGF